MIKLLIIFILIGLLYISIFIIYNYIKKIYLEDINDLEYRMIILEKYLNKNKDLITFIEREVDISDMVTSKRIERVERRVKKIKEVISK